MKHCVLSLLACGLYLGACAGAAAAADVLKSVAPTGAPAPDSAASEASAPAAFGKGAGVPVLSTSVEAQGYRLRSGDQIRIDVVDFPDLSREQLILPDGTINLTYLGAVRAAGRTPEQLTSVLTQQFRGIIRKPVVSVSVMRTRPLKVNVVGEVQRPGPQTFLPQTANAATLAAAGTNPTAVLGVETVTSALALAGGVSASADVRKITLVRQTADGPSEKHIDLWSALKTGDFSQDYTLVDGDTIKVAAIAPGDPEARQLVEDTQVTSIAPRELQVQVMGEVKQAGTVTLPARTNSVLNAIGLAGGPTNEADVANIVVARLDRSGKVERTPLDLNRLADGRQNFTMRNGDVILIGRKGINQFGDDASSILSPFVSVLRVLTFGLWRF
jgi:polysaccharide export outer membrane protein